MLNRPIETGKGPSFFFFPAASSVNLITTSGQAKDFLLPLSLFFFEWKQVDVVSPPFFFFQFWSPSTGGQLPFFFPRELGPPPFFLPFPFSRTFSLSIGGAAAALTEVRTLRGTSFSPLATSSDPAFFFPPQGAGSAHKHLALSVSPPFRLFSLYFPSSWILFWDVKGILSPFPFSPPSPPISEKTFLLRDRDWVYHDPLFFPTEGSSPPSSSPKEDHPLPSLGNPPPPLLNDFLINFRHGNFLF